MGYGNLNKFSITPSHPQIVCINGGYWPHCIRHCSWMTYLRYNMPSSFTHAPKDKIIFSCTCSNNLGQLATAAATSLSIEEKLTLGSIIPLACSTTPPVTEYLNADDTIVAVDGCEQTCCKKILENAGIHSSYHLIITDLGIDPSKLLTIDPADFQLVKDAITACCAEVTPQAPPGGCLCGIG